MAPPSVEELAEMESEMTQRRYSLRQEFQKYPDEAIEAIENDNFGRAEAICDRAERDFRRLVRINILQNFLRGISKLQEAIATNDHISRGLARVEPQLNSHRYKLAKQITDDMSDEFVKCWSETLLQAEQALKRADRLATFYDLTDNFHRYIQEEIPFSGATIEEYIELKDVVEDELRSTHLKLEDSRDILYQYERLHIES